MKFLHLADLHLGKQLNDVSLLDDQKDILFNQIVPIAKEERVDAVLIAGDVYQRSTPQAEAMEVFSQFLSKLVDLGMSIFMISGNHDSAQRISYFAPLLKESGVYVSEAFEGKMQSVTLQDQDGEIVIWMLPFLRPAHVKRWLPEEKILTYQDAMTAVLRQNPIDTKIRNVLICHQFITGSETSESEEHSVGGLDNIDTAVFDDFDYVALGHIHKPQKMGRETLRYAGSPMKYSFSEEKHKKSVTIVDMQVKGKIEVKTIPLYPIHDVRKVAGMINDILSMPYSEDYIWATVYDENPSPDTRIMLKSTFPNMMKYSVVNSKTKIDMDVTAKEDMKSKSILELFTDFYCLQHNGQSPENAHIREIEKVLKELEEEDL